MDRKTQWFKALAIPFLLYGLFFVLLMQNTQAQEITVRGTVLYHPEMNTCLKKNCEDSIKLTKEEDWVPTPGAVNILVKGTDRMTKTNREGNYSIKVRQNDILVFLYLAHRRIEVPVNGQEVIDIKLTPTPLPVIKRLLGLIMPKIVNGKYPDIDNLAEEADVNRPTARAMVWLVLGNRRMAQEYPGEFIPNYEFE